MERTIVHSICLICHQPFESQSQENTLGFRLTWKRIWNILVQYFYVDPSKWEDILNFYDQVFELPLCPDKCRKDLCNLLNLQDKLESILEEMNILRGNITTTILNPSSSSSSSVTLQPSNKADIKMETEIIPAQNLQENKDHSKIINDTSIQEKIKKLRNHIANNYNPKLVLVDVQGSKNKSNIENKDCDNNTEDFLCENSNNNSSITTESANNKQESQIKNNFHINEFLVANSSTNNIDKEPAKLVVKEENETIENNVTSDNLTMMENDYLPNDFHCNGNRDEVMMESDSLTRTSEEVERDGKIKEEKMKEGIFSYEQWSYVQLEGDDMFTCLKCEARERSREEMIQHIQCQHEQTPTEPTEESILGIPHESDEKNPNPKPNTKKRMKVTKPIEKQTLLVPKGRIFMKSRWSCNYPGCGKVVRSNLALLNHKKIHYDILYKCPLCKKTSRMKIEIEDHFLHAHPEYPSLVPLETHKTFLNSASSTSTSTNHDQPSKKAKLDRKNRMTVTTATEKPLYSCKTCKKDFCSFYGLCQHNEAIHKGVIYKCPLCGVQKFSRLQMRYHLKTNHPHVDTSTLPIHSQQRSKSSNDGEYNDDDPHDETEQDLLDQVGEHASNSNQYFSDQMMMNDETMENKNEDSYDVIILD